MFAFFNKVVWILCTTFFNVKKERSGKGLSIYLLQLDDNLNEGEPYNRLARKNKRRLNVARQNSNISEMWETGFKNPPKRTASALAPVRCPRHTDFFRSISTYSIVIDADLYCKYVNLQMCTKCTHKSYIKKQKISFFYNVLGVCILSSKHYIFRNRIKLRPFYAHLDLHISKRKKFIFYLKNFPNAYGSICHFLIGTNVK